MLPSLVLTYHVDEDLQFRTHIRELGFQPDQDEGENGDRHALPNYPFHEVYVHDLLLLLSLVAVRERGFQRFDAPGAPAMFRPELVCCGDVDDGQV